MSRSPRLLRYAILVIGAVLASLSLTACDDNVEATVTHIVDGDTIDVEYDGKEARVRLLNIDTPETVDPDVDPQCMGPEATQFLKELLPVGTEVELQGDEELHDQYGRYLAGVYLDETLVNAQIARAGLAVPVLYEPNDRFYDEVVAAHQEARAAERGLYDPDAPCTLPAQVASVTDTVESLQEVAPAAGSELDTLEDYGEEIAAAASSAAALQELLDGDHSRFPLVAFDTSRLVDMRRSVSDASVKLDAVSESNREIVAAEEARQEAAEEAARQAEAEEAARQAAAEQERQEAAQRESEEAAAQEAEQQAQAEAESHAEPEDPDPPQEQQEQQNEAPAQQPSEPKESTGGYDGYTGCRAYGGFPPNAVDEKGRPYTKIDCDTRTPIG